MEGYKKDQNKRTASYVDEVFRQVQQKPDISDILILNTKGNPIKTTMEKSEAVQYAGQYESLRYRVAIAVEKSDAEDELTMLRVRTTKYETIIVPDGKITVMVLQTPKDRYHNI